MCRTLTRALADGCITTDDEQPIVVRNRSGSTADDSAKQHRFNNHKSDARSLLCTYSTHNIGFVVSLSVEFETILHEEPICQRSSGARVISMRDS